MSDIYEPYLFIDALSELYEEGQLIDFNLKFIGSISSKILNYLKESSFYQNVELISTVPHDEITNYQLNSNLLLLVIPNVDKSEGILTGKIFEYLAAGNKILIGPIKRDAAKIIKECNAGQTFDRTKIEPIKEYVLNIYKSYKLNTIQKNNIEQVNRYNRKNQAEYIEFII